MPQTDVPKEWTAPTQPFPTKPPAFDLQGITEDDLIDFTPELRAEAIKAIEGYKLGPIYTPPIAGRADGNKGTIVVPGLRRRRQLARRRGGSGDRLRLRRLDDEPGGDRARAERPIAQTTRRRHRLHDGAARCRRFRGCAC